MFCSFLSAVSCDEPAKFFGEACVGSESVEGEMESVAPIVFGIGGIVDLLGRGVGGAKCFTHGEPVLNGLQAEHGGRSEVIVQDGFACLGIGFVGCLVVAAKNFVPVGLCAFLVLAPPKAQGRHVMCARGADAEIGVVGWATKACPRGFGHSLDFEGEDMQFGQYAGYALGHESEVFCAREQQVAVGIKGHGVAYECRKFFHGFCCPKCVVTMEEEIFV